MLLRAWRRFKYVSRIALGRNHAGRDLTVFPDDVFLVSYPRSGNTWTRFLIANLIYPNHPVNFANIESRVPEIYLFRDRSLRALPRPRILKSHEYFDPRYKRVIYIVRDPRDVAVSVYHYSIKRRDIPEDYPIGHFIPRFIAGEFFVDFATWGEHVASWTASRLGKPGFLMLRYEDMLANPQLELSKVAALLDLKVTPEILQQAAERSSAAEMRSLEKQQGEVWKLTKTTRQDKPFVRAANSGGWKTVLDPQSVAAIENAWSSTMQENGYSASTSVSCQSFPEPVKR